MADESSTENTESSKGVDSTCEQLLEGMRKQADQYLGNERFTPFADTILGDNEDASDVIGTLFNTDDYNTKWVEIYNNPNIPEEPEGVRARLSVAYLASWKRALLRHFHNESTVERVFNRGINFINTGAQSIEATRVILSDPPTAETDSK